MLGQLGAILEQLGDKMRPKSAKMSQDGAHERQDEARYPNLGAGSSPREAGGFAATRGEQPCTPLRMYSPEWDSVWISRLRLQLELDLENWKTGRLDLE